MEEVKQDGAKIVSAALLGFDFRRVLVNDVSYVIKPPTIHRIAAAAYWLSDVGESKTFKDSLRTLASLDNACRALSCLIQGNEDLWQELANGTVDEVIDALADGFDLVSVENFLKLSALTRSAKRMIARPT